MSQLSIWYSAKKKKKKKRFKKSECTCHWKACSAFSGCFCSSFIHSVCTIYDHAFWGVHWLKRICHKRCYKRIYYPVYGSLSTINHGDILTGHNRSVMFVLRREIKKKKEKRKKKKSVVSFCLRHSGHSGSV